MKFQWSIIVLLLFSVVLWNCGKSPLEQADQAFQEKNYGKALKNYLKLVKESPQDPVIKERIATSFFMQGEKLYRRAKVIRAFEDRVKRGLTYLPDSLSPEMKQTLSTTHFKLAMANKAATPENAYQKKQYFDKILHNLDKALQYNPDNQEAAKALQTFKEANFQENLNKGIRYYKKGSRDALQYLAADYYLNNALTMNPENEDAAKYLRLTRTKALNLLDPGQQAPIAITDRMENGTYLAFLVVLLNQTQNHLPVSAGNFYLIAEDGQSYQGRTSEMFSSSLQPVTLKNGEETGGVVAFPLKKGQRFGRLEFRGNGEVLGTKKLP